MNHRDPDNSQNVMIAIALSMVVLFAWQYFYAGPKMKAEQERVAREAAPPAKTTATPAAPATEGTAPAVPGNAPTTTAPVAPPGSVAAPAAHTPGVSRAAAVAGGSRLPIKTPSLTGSINLKGARIDDLVLAKYREKVNPSSPNVVLLSPADAPEPYFAELGWVSATAGQKMPDRDSVWAATGAKELTPATPVTLTWDNGTGLKFERTIAVDADYLFTIKDRVISSAPAEAQLHSYGRIYRYGTPLVQGYYILHEGLIGVAGDEGLQEITYADARKPEKRKSIDNAKGGWLGITDKYWATALIPDQKTPFRATFAGTAQSPLLSADTYQTDFLQAPVTIAPGQSHTVESHLYAGAKQVGIVEGYQDKLGIKQFDLMVDWGWFYFITKPLFYLIDWLYKLIGNFGIAILVVTVIVKAAFFPLANKSYESMAKMKKLQPEMEKLRERFKDDKAHQQQELMALYQKEKINPLAGCLPILLQIPVF
ncbi:MAG: membrane protein insertase YidC, partial [Hyphomicrobiaceae bacterium]